MGRVEVAMIDVHITQFNVQLYFRRPILEDSGKVAYAFNHSEGFTASRLADDGGDRGNDSQHQYSMHDMLSFFKEGFRIAPVQSNVLPFRILQVMSYPNTLKNPDAETVACLHFVAASLRQHLNVDINNDIYAARVVFHSIVTGSSNIHKALSKITRIDSIPTLAGKYIGHKNPMDAIQLTSKTDDDGSLHQESWNDIRLSQFFNSNSYVVTIFNETTSLAHALHFIKNVKQFVATFMHEIEAAAIAESAC